MQSLSSTPFYFVDCMTQPLATFHGHSLSVNTVAYTPNGTYVLSGSQDRSIGIWNPHKNVSVSLMKGAHSAGIFDVRANSDNTKIISCGEDRRTNLWDMNTSKVIRNFIQDKKVNFCRLNTNEEVLFTGADDQKVSIWDCRRNSRFPVHCLNQFKDSPMCMALTGSYSMIVGSVDGYIRKFDLRMLEVTEDNVSPSPVVSFSLSPNHEFALIFCLDNAIRLIDMRTGERANTYKGHSAQNVRGGVLFSSSGEKVCATSEDGRLVFWDLLNEKGGALGWISNAHAGRKVLSLGNHPAYGHSQFVSGGEDGTVKVWRHIDALSLESKGGSECIQPE